MLIGSEDCVLQASIIRTSIRLRLFVDQRLVWEDSGPLSVHDGDEPEDLAKAAASISLVRLLGPRLFDEARLQLDALPHADVVFQVQGDEFSLARWGELTRSGLVVDYSGKLGRRALEPVQLPIGVLIADLNKRFEYEKDRKLPLHHFATTALGYVSVARLERTLAQLPHDIVHLRVRVVKRADEIWLGSPDTGMRARRLGSLLRSPREWARLLILEVDSADTVAALLLARRIRRMDGPSVLVANKEFNFRNLYYEITHDKPLRVAVEWCRSPTHPDDQLPRLFIADGGDETLRLNPVETVFKTTVRAERERLRLVRNRLGANTRGFNQDTATVPAQIPSNLEFGYHAESAGLEPMSDASIELERSASMIRAAERSLVRVVNTWFSSSDDKPILPTTTLTTGQHYSINVSIGPPARQSNIKMPFAVDEDALAEEFRDGGTPVRVVLISDDVVVPQPSVELFVPPPPQKSAVATFEILTPPQAGRVSARVALYAGNNLLQSVVLNAEVTIQPDERRGANTGRVDWVLTGQVEESTRLEHKAISVLTNEHADGTHLIALESTGFRCHLSLATDQVTKLLDQARLALQWSAGDPEKKQSYRYGHGNTGDPNMLRTYLSGIAELGWNMYDTLLIGKQDDQFEEDLEHELTGFATIQFARTGSSRLMYPWALVYDHPLIPNKDNTLCERFLATVIAREPIDASPCFLGNCPNKNDTNVVCPSGFWGYRHIVEQPLGSFDPVDVDVITGHSDALDVIQVGDSIDTFIGYSTDLDPKADHVNEILALAGIAGSRATALKDVGRHLQRSELSLVYFFCHGGSNAGNPWLGVGGTPPERLLAPNLRAWKVQWPISRPLVFINGCETAAARPDDLAVFNDSLRYCKASGVIGSEIKIPVELGREVGTTLLNHIVVDRISVGTAIRKMRLDLLAKYNPLGLAYTPYCLAELRMS